MTGFGSSCGACKFLRRRCTNDCVFAPYFCYEQAASHFAAVHKVFGASNVSKLLLHLPVHYRSDAAITISYEALARMRDPIYGCVAQIFALQQQVASLQEEIELLGNQMAANQTVGVVCSGSSQAPNEFLCIQPYFSPYPDAMNTQNYQNQQAEAGQLNHVGDTNASQVFDTPMNIQIPSINEWEEQNILPESSPDYLQKFLEEMDQENITYLQRFLQD